MANAFYNPSGNPATGSQGLSSVVRTEFALVGVAFDHMPQISTTGVFNTIFAQQGNFTFTLPAATGTLAMLSDVAAEAVTRAAADTTNASAINANSAAIALLAPKDAPTFTTSVALSYTLPTLDHSNQAVSSTWVSNFLAASGYAPTGASPVVTVAGRTGAVTLTHADLTDWAATLAPYSAATTAETVRAQAVEVQALNASGRNLFHNPIFRVQQRGIGPWSTSGSYTADQWKMEFTGGTMSVGISPFLDATRVLIGDENAVSYLSMNVAGGASAGDFSILSQPIEGVSRLSNKTVTVSFWAYASATPKLGVGIRQVFGTGGSPSALVDMTGQSVTLSTTPTRYSLTFAVPSTSGKTFGTTPNTDYTRIAFAFSSGTTNAAKFGTPGTQSTSFVMWGMQCEIAPTASPLEKLDPQQDFARCQRFYQTGTAQYYGYQVGTTLVAVARTLPVTMRATPTIVYTGSVSGNAIGTTVAALDAGTVNISATGASTGAFALQGTFTASAEL